MLFNLNINNKTAQEISPVPFLTNNFIYRGDKIMADLDSTKKKKICQVGWCDRPVRRNGYCERHSGQMKRIGKIVKTYMDKPKRFCKVDGCGKEHHSHGYCTNHSRHYSKYGHIKERTRLDPNEFRSDGVDCYISLYDNWGDFIVETVIDRDDYEKVKGYKWRLSAQGYVVCNIGSSKEQMSLHRLIIDNFSDTYDTDHINMDKLNNRKSNLRFATRAENMWNTNPQSNGLSQYKGVFFVKNNSKSKWGASIRANGANIYLGSFITEIEAANVYDKACMELHGEFARPNFWKDEALSNAI